MDTSHRCQKLAQRVYAQYLLKPDERLIIGLSGIPGAGKSTISRLVVKHINDLHQIENRRNVKNSILELAVSVPMDGFHFTRAQLMQMPQPEVAMHRRGASFTYDAEAYLAFIERLRQPAVPGQTIYAPSFDHAIKDPIEDDIVIPWSSRIVIIEGNYCALNRTPWSTAAGLMDELWLASIDREVARGRLALRHVKSGVTPDLESALERIRSTDFLNADDIVENALSVHEIIDS